MGSEAKESPHLLNTLFLWLTKWSNGLRCYEAIGAAPGPNLQNVHFVHEKNYFFELSTLFCEKVCVCKVDSPSILFASTFLRKKRSR